jgi:hypothetical protein
VPVSGGGRVVVGGEGVLGVSVLIPSLLFQVRRVLIAGPVIPFCPWSEHRHFYLLK